MREADLTGFLDGAGWGAARRVPLAGDASARRYERLTHPDLGPAILMDAAPSAGEATQGFAAIARHLHAIGLSAPRVFAHDPQAGFMLLEDLGDDLFAHVLRRTPDRERTLYLAAIDAMIAFQDATPPPGTPAYGAAEMTQTALLALDWYVPQATGTPVPPESRNAYTDLLDREMSRHLNGPPVLVHRDYHAENLIWLPSRSEAARVGLLDFQDAMLGHPAYDIASLLIDVRREVSPETRRACLDRYLSLRGRDPETFEAALALCSAQRNLRIMGVFTRLCVRDGKARYADMLPVVWRNLGDDLSHPALPDLQAAVAHLLPAPDAGVLARIKSERRADRGV